jgi:hypothetical protein
MLLYNNGTDVIVAFNRVVGNLVGTASNATVLQTARNIQISGNVTAANVSFDGSAAVNLNVTDINAAGITSGTLGVARGGTGASTLTAENVIIGNGTSAVKFVAPGTTGNVLTSNGTAWLSQAIAAGGDYIMQVYTSSTTWTKPAGLKAVKVTLVGAGGNGSAGAGVPDPCGPVIAKSGGNGGGGGAAIEYLDAPAIPGPVTVTVGTAPSKTSSFGPFLSATGGTNGVAAPASAPGASATGGTGSGGQINLTGDTGYGLGRDPQGSGGSWGGMGAGGFSTRRFNPPSPGPNATVKNGTAGDVYGAGGVGGHGAGGAAGNGGAGIVIVEEFY